METVKTTCRSCGSACSVIVTLDGDKLVSIRPDPDGPVNHGVICPKCLGEIELLHHPDRLKYPMKRIGARGEGKWQRISWDEAFDILTENITRIKEKYGAEAISMAQGTGRHHLKHTIRFAYALGTPNWYEPGAAQCYFPRVCAGLLMYGAECGAFYDKDYMPKCCLIWGSNPSESSAGPRSQLYRDAVRGNMELIVVDPRRTKMAEKAKYWLRIRPGTDAALALGFMHIIIEENLYDSEFVENYTTGFPELRERCREYIPERVSEITGIPTEQIVEAARFFANSKPATLEWGCSLEHTPNALQTVRAVAMLPCLTGNYDVPGGWVENLPLMPTPDILTDVLPKSQHDKRFGAKQFPLLSSIDNNPCPTSHTPTLYKAALTGEPYPLKALLLFGNNSKMEIADSNLVQQVFEKMEFVSCMDLFMTPTAQMADLVLPAASWMEYDHVCGGAGLSGTAVLCVKKLVTVGECRPDEEVFCELANRLGLPYRAKSVYDIMNEQLSYVGKYDPAYEGLTFEKIREMNWLQFPMKYEKYKQRGGFRTPSGKLEFYSGTMEKLGLDPLPSFVEPPESPRSEPELAKQYPLTCVTGSRQREYFASEGKYLPLLRRRVPFPEVGIHPETATKYGLENGEWAFIENRRGKITMKVSYDDGLDKNVITCPIGWYYPEAGAPDYDWNVSNVNILTTQEPPYDPNSGTYQLTGFLCRVLPNPDGKKIEERFYTSPYWKAPSNRQYNE